MPPSRAVAAISLLIAGLAGVFPVGCGGGARAPQVEFTDASAGAGIDRVTQTYDAAVGDFDGDGRPDVFVGNHATPASLLHNRGDGTFEDVIARSGIEPSGDKHGAAWTDIDNDGRLDLYVTLGAGRGHSTKRNPLYRNQGSGELVDVSEAAGVGDPSGRARAAASLDVDGDGWLDLFVANYASPNRLFRNRGDGTYEDVSDAFGISARSATRVTWADFDADGRPDLLLGGTAGGIALLRNDGGQRFVDFTAQAGLAEAGRSVSGASFGDFDNDGVLDLYLGEGADFSDVVLEQPDGAITYAFFAGEEPVGFDFESSAPAIDAEVYENGSLHDPSRVRCGRDLRPEAARFRCSAESAASSEMPAGPGLVLWRSPEPLPGSGGESPYRWHLRWQGAGDHHQTGILRGGRRPVAVGMSRPAVRGGSLWRGVRGGTFRQLEVPSLEHEANSQAVQWGDVNADGALDLYVVDSGVDGRGGRNVLFLNDRSGGFVRAPDTAGAAPSSGDGRGVGAHFLDYDLDGFLDLFLTNGWGAPPFDRGPHRLLRNRGAPERHWLGVDLRGRRSNRPGLGARVEIEACGATQVRYHNGGASYYSQSIVAPNFGLDDCRNVDLLRVRWPSGAVQEAFDLGADRTVVVSEDAGTEPR